MNEDKQVRKDLGQYFTPVWVAEKIVEKFFPELDETSMVLEPSCGAGAFLQAIPAHVPAMGIEIDPRWAKAARAAARREVIEGDFTKIDLHVKPTHIIGNPPFRMSFLESLLDRAGGLMDEGGRVGLILPAYMFQTPSRVVRWSQDWSLAQEMLPRTVFGTQPGDVNINKPIVFAMFSKDKKRMMAGFALYNEVHDVATMPEWARDILREHAGSVWRETVIKALAMGGTARLDEIYAAVAPKRPSGTPWWREQVRRNLASAPFTRVGEATYSLREAA